MNILFKEAFSSGAGMVLSEAQRAQDENERAETPAERVYSGREYSSSETQYIFLN